MPLYEVGGNRPRIHPSTFVHPQANLLGRVQIGHGCYIGAGAVLRGDWGSILVGAGSNIQDNCVVHGYPGGEVVLEDEAHLGHGCVVHGAVLRRNVLVGMNATVSDGVELGEGSVVGAGALVPAGLWVPPGKLVLGVPGRIVGDVRPALTAEKRLGTLWYQELARRCPDEVLEVELAACLAEDAGEPPAGATRAGLQPPGQWQPWIEQTELFLHPAGGGSGEKGEK